MPSLPRRLCRRDHSKPARALRAGAKALREPLEAWARATSCRIRWRSRPTRGRPRTSKPVTRPATLRLAAAHIDPHATFRPICILGALIAALGLGLVIAGVYVTANMLRHVKRGELRAQTVGPVLLLVGVAI